MLEPKFVSNGKSNSLTLYPSKISYTFVNQPALESTGAGLAGGSGGVVVMVVGMVGIT